MSSKLKVFGRAPLSGNKISPTGKAIKEWAEGAAEEGMLYTQRDLARILGVTTTACNEAALDSAILQPYTLVTVSNQMVKSGLRLWGTKTTIAEAIKEGV